VLQTAIAVLVPVLPLALTMISLEDLIKRLLGILL
jgi:threonine/homoserine efflux transporter RhtA